MGYYTSAITPEMTQTVDKLRATNFADATPEEIELYAEWTRLFALQEAEFEERKRLREQEADARMKQDQEKHEAAIDALTALTDLAKAKLRSVQDGA